MPKHSGYTDFGTTQKKRLATAISRGARGVFKTACRTDRQRPPSGPPSTPSDTDSAKRTASCMAESKANPMLTTVKPTSAAHSRPQRLVRHIESVNRWWRIVNERADDLGPSSTRGDRPRRRLAIVGLAHSMRKEGCRCTPTRELPPNLRFSWSDWIGLLRTGWSFPGGETCSCCRHRASSLNFSSLGFEDRNLADRRRVKRLPTIPSTSTFAGRGVGSSRLAGMPCPRRTVEDQPIFRSRLRGKGARMAT